MEKQKQLVALSFRPPLAIARVGGSTTPMQSFTWATSRDAHGDNRTIIVPAPTFTVRDDGSLEACLPDRIRFKDGDDIRPVAPFFELWAQCAGEPEPKPVTLETLEALGIDLDSVKYRITVANRKAQRRCGSAACAFIASAQTTASDSAPRPLLACSPHGPNEVPLVAPDRRIPLGSFRAIQPLPRKDTVGTELIDFAVLRVRFTPAAGKVYGPPNATIGPASPVPPGTSLAQITEGGRLHKIVPLANRILNPGTAWSKYQMEGQSLTNPTIGVFQQDPQPSDSYDGANAGFDLSWGVVDDTCDGVIEAELVVGGQRFVAHASVLTACPDYAPDRRPFYSLADDLADRDPPASDATMSRPALEDEVADLFRRVFESAATINLDAIRQHAVVMNGPDASSPDGWPRVDDGTMTKDDTPFADIVPPLLPVVAAGARAQVVSRVPLSYSPIVRTTHGKLSDKAVLLDLLASRADRVRELLRPPYGRLSELPEVPDDPGPGVPGTPLPPCGFRDARVARDTLHDMRMPPYTKDSDSNPLSVTHRQYEMIMRLVDLLEKENNERKAARAKAEAEKANKRAAVGSAPSDAGTQTSPTAPAQETAHE